MSATVTIDRGYFDTLLRRAELHTTGHELSTPLHLPLVTIPKCDHDNLLQAAREYLALKNALLEGGISDDALNVLVQNGLSLQQTEHKLNPEATPFTIVRNLNAESSPRSPLDSGKRSLAHWPNGASREVSSWHSDFQQDEESFEYPNIVREESGWQTISTEKPLSDNGGKKTLLIKNLPTNVTIKEIVNLIRGGALLDVYIKFSTKCAFVSFVDPDAAHAFMKYAKRKGIYLQGKMLEVTLITQHFNTPEHVARHIAAGATRNLILHGPSVDIVPEQIRLDLDHIHNLTIVDIYRSPEGDGTVISLNAVRIALYARTCMASRATYKRRSIRFYPDECASIPIPPLSSVPKHSVDSVGKKREPSKDSFRSLQNRFNLLNLDGTEKGSSATETDSTLTTDSPRGGISCD